MPNKKESVWTASLCCEESRAAGQRVVGLPSRLILGLCVLPQIARSTCCIGIIMSGNDVSIVMLSLTLTYYGSKRNRPLWMGVGGVITAISCFLIALPHFIYGPGKDALALTKEFWDQEFDNLSLSQIKEAAILQSDVISVVLELSTRVQVGSILLIVDSLARNVFSVYLI
uniref:Uncharacterized protein n=1 Tax=Timema genevievae TaxID=629358 RepID=A0A7R9JTV9_TIMGE|nr:unnamed protein product [Timema genevievae]